MNSWKRFLAVWIAIESGIYGRNVTGMQPKIKAAYLRYLKVTGEEECA